MKKLIVIMAVLLSAIITNAGPIYIDASIEPYTDADLLDTIISDTGGLVFTGQTDIIAVLVSSMDAATKIIEFYDTTQYVASSANEKLSFRVECASSSGSIMRIWPSPVRFSSNVMIREGQGPWRSNWKCQIWYKK